MNRLICNFASQRPHFLRAAYEWMKSREYIIYVVVNATYANVSVPQEYVQNGMIILDISASAVKQFKIEDSHIEFNARFGGIYTDVYIPLQAINEIYDGKANTWGILFTDEYDDSPKLTATTSSVKSGVTGKKGSAGPKLTIVK